MAKVDRALLVKLEAIRRDVEMLRTDLITSEREKLLAIRECLRLRNEVAELRKALEVREA